LWYADEQLALAPVARWRMLIRAAAAALIIVLVAAVATTLLNERRSVLRSMAESGHRSAQLLGVVVDQMIRDADGLADGLQMVLAATTTAAPDGVVNDATWAWLEQRMAERPAVRSHHLVDRDGVVRRATYEGLVGRGVAERPHVRMHRDGLAAGVQQFSVDPFLSPSTGHRELLVSWPLRDAVGELVGVFAVGFNTEVVEQRLGQLVDPAHDIVALVSGDGVIMAAAGMGSRERPWPAAWDDGVASLLAAAARGDDDERGGVERIQPFGTQPRWLLKLQPLAMVDGSIVLARNLDGALGGWQRHAVTGLVGTGLLVAAIMASAAALTGLLERQGRALLAATTDALVDPLTGLFNRRMFDAVAGLELSRARRHRSALTVVLIDIDHFKAVNDRHGHAAGDAVLVAVARQLKSLMRREDLLARFGGEEFALLLPQLPLAATLRQAERLREAIERLDVAVHGALIKVTVSIGIATVGQGEPSIEAALAAADAALYRAKAAGRNRVVVTEAPPPAPTAERLISA
jgi:diguanylate cyclase (GGDEF)-like protein